MTNQIPIPAVFMRGGTSRGLLFHKKDLPEDKAKIAKYLLKIMGSPDIRQINGMGGGTSVTSKVCIISKSLEKEVDIDYFFAQVSVQDQLVDYKPTCGNMLTAVGPAAIEMGLIKAEEGYTEIKINAVNTGANIVVKVRTKNGQVIYDGDTQIDGVPGTAAPVEMRFLSVSGSSTGAFLPTGQVADSIEGMEVTCMDVAMPMVIAKACDFGLTGQETPEELDSNVEFFEHMERVRLAAAIKMGMGDCTQSVTPKFGLVARDSRVDHLIVRYFMPWNTHPTLAVTGSQCMASCALTPGTVAYELMDWSGTIPAHLFLSHPTGIMEVMIDFDLFGKEFIHKAAGLIRTARKLAEGKIFIPNKTWNGFKSEDCNN